MAEGEMVNAASTTPIDSIPDEITVHVSADFRHGSHSNVLVDGGLRMANEDEYVPRGAPPDQKYGVYLSPEQEALQSFDELILQSEARVPEESELAFEFRTRAVDGDWSVWRRIEPNQMSQPIAVGSPANAWQYRLTFFAQESAPGPEVESVAFVTRPVALRAAENPAPEQPVSSIR